MTKVLIHSADVLGSSMAGPAIRYWEMAKTLSQHFDVTLSTPNRPDIEDPNFTIVSQLDHSFYHLLQDQDFIITQYLNPIKAFQLKKTNTKIILDLYDPVPLEALEIDKTDPEYGRVWKNKHNVNRINLCTRLADGFLCANQQQFHLWTGLLMSQFCITPQRYDLSSTFQDFLSIVPFGLPSTPPVKKGEGIRYRFNLKETDKIILWGGGIWNWFDPLTLIQAIDIISKTRDDIKLVFMGIKHPNDTTPTMSMSTKALELSKNLQLLNKHVFFNFEWVPYEERTGFLLEADIGTSIHSQHLETIFAFRTRILDYLWSELPIIATTGDSFADLIERENLGIIVPYEDPKALANAIVRLSDDDQLRDEVKESIRRVKKSFFWENVTTPIVEMIKKIDSQSTTKLSMREKLSIFWKFANSYFRVMLLQK